MIYFNNINNHQNMIPSYSHLNAKHSHTTQACTKINTVSEDRLGNQATVNVISYRSFSDYTVAGVDKNNMNSPLPR